MTAAWPNISVQRDGTVLQITLHSEGGPLRWGAREGSIHDQLGRALREIARDRSVCALIVTGAGDAFCAEMNLQELPPPEEHDAWLRLMREGQELLMAMIDLEVPVVAAVNGPALIHAELPLLADVVLASRTAVFADIAHIAGGVVPGDGAHVIWPLLLGPNRGRHFLWTGRRIPADEAQTLGLVAEVLEPDALLPRAWTIARQVAALPPATSRLTRLALMQPFKLALQQGLSHGLALEGLALALSMR